MEEQNSWQVANDYCIQNGGHLASVHSEAENELVKGDNWIGLIKSSTNGQFHWSDMTPYDYPNWADGGKVYNHEYIIGIDSFYKCNVRINDKDS